MKKKSKQISESRQKLENHVRIYFGHWGEQIGTMTDLFLLMHVHPQERRIFRVLFSQTLKKARLYDGY